MEALREINVSEDMKDLKGWTIPKGTVLHVIKECPVHPTLNHRVLLVRVDNGTGSFDLMPETVIHEAV